MSTFFARLVSLWVVLISLTLTGLGSAGLAYAQGTAVPDAGTVSQTQTTQPSQTVGADAYSYKMGADDKIRVIVFGEPDLSGEFVVNGQGTVALPLIGEVKAVGLTVRELQEQYAAVLREGYLKDPRVSIEVLTFRPFYVLGEVSRPGEYPYVNGMTVMNAIARAQGFTYRANKKKVYIKSANSAEERAVDLTQTLTVQPGDTIRVTERYF
ncbi:polysaccharide biosynthesis/export family protein [Asticcacaulis sp. ZE23SCel15]|uniref:polysaccharide biosynthesis/export family protein n=1 Tax=Asticcacaulis sp. ZE23SCel15 TaxID=3059027 RepID=UPI00265DCD7E|nr:polysaccharide biosynthesis/export family protein [Asticcacaulis sp. ZE23SCel15]WKL58592.1 polysaccharide biosynthesis/export family protein [Asticcacaulis sp. ZE23SCel15]